MANINPTKHSVLATRITSEITTNEEGAPAFVLPAKTRLIERVLGAFWSEDSFYKKGAETAEAIVKDIEEVSRTDPKFILQLAAYARNEVYMRTTPQVLLAEASRLEYCKPYIRQYTPKIVKRPDEICDVLAYLITKYGDKDGKNKKIPNQLKWGLADAFQKFDEYQLFKYDSNKSKVSLGGALRLIHRHAGFPVSKAMSDYLEKDLVDEEALPKIAAVKRLLQKDTIDVEAINLIEQSHVTWEVLISKFGSTKDTWSIVAPNMPYMAKLRNLNNFLKNKVDVSEVLEELTDPIRVKNSKQLPFRFYSAYHEVDDQKIRRAIAKALELSVSNVPLEGKTAVAVDLSGSMAATISEKSKVQRRNIGTILGAIAVKKSNESIAIGFGTHALEARLNPDDTILTNMEKIDRLPTDHSTEAWKIFGVIGNRVVDRIIVLSDMQCYGGTGWFYGGTSLQKAFDTYVKEVNPKAKLYSIDLAAYGTSQFPSFQKNVVLLSGWSDKVLDLINLTENKDAMIGAISKW